MAGCRIISPFILGALAGSLACLAESAPCHAAWALFPESRHQLFQSYSFFIEQHNIIAYRGSNRYWAAAAVSLPLAGDDEGSYRPQVIFHFSGNDSMHVDAAGGVYTETLDTRIGLALEFSPPLLGLRCSAGLFHESGHTVDGTEDPDLSPLNLGVNVLRIRVLRDQGRWLRVGFTFNPILHAIPETLDSGLNEFAEVFPWGSNEDTSRPSPFLAAGVSNPPSLGGASSAHAQLGLSFGGHFERHHTRTARLALGYYNGTDPRAKYSLYGAARSEFGYLGLMFDL